jgi:hypothetical protein
MPDGVVVPAACCRPAHRARLQGRGPGAYSGAHGLGYAPTPLRGWRMVFPTWKRAEGAGQERVAGRAELRGWGVRRGPVCDRGGVGGAEVGLVGGAAAAKRVAPIPGSTYTGTYTAPS